MAPFEVAWDSLRLVPRRGAGPELRSSGREIDEYLMRLLHAGAVDPSQDAAFHNLVGPRSAAVCHAVQFCLCRSGMTIAASEGRSVPPRQMTAATDVHHAAE